MIYKKYIWWYTSPNGNFEYGYPHSNAKVTLFLQKLSENIVCMLLQSVAASCIKPLTSKWKSLVCLIWFFMSQSTIFQLCRDRSSWVEIVLSKDKCVFFKDTTQWRRWGWNLPPLSLKSSTLQLRSLCQRKATLLDDVKFATVYRRMYCRKSKTFANQMSHFFAHALRYFLEGSKS